MHENLKIIFAGTPDFSSAALQTLFNSRHEVVAVYTQPDRPAGRGRKVKPSSVKKTALLNNAPIFQPKKLDNKVNSQLRKHNADIMIVSAYGLLLPKEALVASRYGCINIHASLLPRWRGAAPIQRAIIEGDAHTGITFMQMVEELDAGPILHQCECDILEYDTGKSLHDRLAEISSKEILIVLDRLINNDLTPIKQDETKVTYANKLIKSEANIDWSESAKKIEREIRAYNSWPIAYSFFQGQRVRIWEAQLSHKKVSNKPGAIIDAINNTIDVSTGDGVISIIKLQLPGGNVISANDFINSHSILNKSFVCEQRDDEIKAHT